MRASPHVGFYGKLPSHGDFLSRRVSPAFVAAWDSWLQQGLSESRAVLGERWLDVYLTSPAWRFACSGGTCGPLAFLGVMVPSVDRVGRYFPLTVVAELSDPVNPLVAAGVADRFFSAAEQLAIETLECERVDFERFDRLVVELGDELEAVGAPLPVMVERQAASILESAGGDEGWHVPIGSGLHLSPVLDQVLGHRLAALYEPFGLWWTEGSSAIEPSCLIAKGLPSPDRFVALLDGSWTERRWRSVPVLVEPTPPADEPLVEEGSAPRFRSAAATDIGRVRRINQDSFLERSDVGVWVVADGLGGHSHGEVASRMVCDALADFVPDSGFEDTIEAACRRVQAVNEQLVREAERSATGERSGSTIVALLARGGRIATIWAGDSRVYRWRGGRLEQLTRDHSVVEEERNAGGDPHAITRAVGAEPVLRLDVHRDAALRGDRFLLCSDGLTRTVPAAQLRAWLEHEDIRGAVDGLVAASLDAGAPDNVTALIVEAYE